MANRDHHMKTSSPFAPFVEPRNLRRMAGGVSFERGEDYFLNGQVKALAEHEGTITAKVQGTRPYRVKFWIDEEDDLEYSCTCPVGADGEFCKHCVAVGLAWLEVGQSKSPGQGKAQQGVTMDDVRAYLLGLDKNALVEMLVDRAIEDDRLRQSLFIKAAKKSSKGLDLATYRRAIDDAVEPDGFVDYRSAYDYAHGIEEAIDSVEELLKEGHPVEVIELAEHALKAVEETMGSVDDSDGYMGGILQRLQDLHHKACRKGQTRSGSAGPATLRMGAAHRLRHVLRCCGNLCGSPREKGGGCLSAVGGCGMDQGAGVRPRPRCPREVREA